MCIRDRLKASLKERNRAVEELEKQLTEQNTALEAGKTRVEETEATAAELRTKLAETRRTVDERDEQLMKLQDELTAVGVCLCLPPCMCVCVCLCFYVCLARYMLLPVRPSVTQVDQLKTVEVRIMQFYHTVTHHSSSCWISFIQKF